jgi:uncharacterized protein
MLEALTRRECVELLSGVPVGRVGVSLGALPAVVPVNYALCDGHVVFRCAPGTKFSAATAGAVVAFEADAYHRDRREGLERMVRGVAEVITEPTELARARQLLLESWALGTRPTGSCASLPPWSAAGASVAPRPIEGRPVFRLGRVELGPLRTTVARHGRRLVAAPRYRRPCPPGHDYSDGGTTVTAAAA